MPTRIIPIIPAMPSGHGPSSRKGRGTTVRIAHRFERDNRDVFDDGWATLGDEAQAADQPTPPATWTSPQGWTSRPG